MLDAVFGDRDAIEGSDQGRSFRAFWDFLMSPDRQEELTSLLHAVMSLEAVSALSPDPRLLRIHYDWLEAGEVAQRTVARLSQQLRRYLDDQAALENRRIIRLIRDIEQHAIAIRQSYPEGPSMEIDEPSPALTEIVEAYPLKRGLAELVAYMSLAADDIHGAMIDDLCTESIVWTDDSGLTREATMPQIVFVRRPAAS